MHKLALITVNLHAKFEVYSLKIRR